MPKLKPNTIWPTPEEDAAITAAAMSDPDALPFTDSEWEIAKHTVRRGRPLTGEPKVAISLRLPTSVLLRWKATGPGWQTRMAEYLGNRFNP
jgi:uncharacterized protein (DUF4415 family)